MKKCFKCGNIKPLEDFYKHPEMADGHLNKCRECAKKDAIKTRNNRIEYYREYDRKRARLPQRVALRRKVDLTWRKDGRAAKAVKHYRQKYPEKYKAHNLVNNALRNKKLTKPKKCSRCGKHTDLLHAHHTEYSKPLDVQWLCSTCHGEEHSKYPKAN